MCTESVEDREEICNEIAKWQPPPNQPLFLPQSQKSQPLLHLHFWAETICIATRKINMHFAGFLQILIYPYKAVIVLMDSNQHQVQESDIL